MIILKYIKAFLMLSPSILFLVPVVRPELVGQYEEINIVTILWFLFLCIAIFFGLSSKIFSFYKEIVPHSSDVMYLTFMCILLNFFLMLFGNEWLIFMVDILGFLVLILDYFKITFNSKGIRRF